MKNINWKQTVIFSAMILAVAIVVSAFSPVQSQAGGSSFMIASDGSQFMWRVNVSTGQVSYCVRRDNSTDENFIAKRAPFCSAQTAPVQ